MNARISLLQDGKHMPGVQIGSERTGVLSFTCYEQATKTSVLERETTLLVMILMAAAVDDAKTPRMPVQST